MAAGVDARDGLLGMEVRRAFDHDGIGLRIQEPLVAGQAREAVGGIDFELLSQTVGAVAEVVRGGHDFVAAMLHKQVRDPLAAAATADDPQLDLAVGLRAEDQFRFDQREPGGGSAGQEPAAIQGGAGLLGVRWSKDASSSNLLGSR